MSIQNKKIGIALCGSFCNLYKAFEIIQLLKASGADVTAIISYNVAKLDTRFWAAEEVKSRLGKLTGKEVIQEITEAEPIGPKDMFDILLVLPATGNTMAKLANGITDTPVLMAIKSHLRGQKPVVIGISTNDALSGSAKNIGKLMNTKNIFFIPFSQDDAKNKPSSVIFKDEFVKPTIEKALDKEQFQPIL
ncbi:MAG: dipicolinate synthase subunit B [Defluviitaleaceae bacterium]|nr:dipicolinate synthase subunit B [Defluviitaleaceae bacterium]